MCPFCHINFKIKNWGLKTHIVRKHGDIYAKIKAEKTGFKCQICQRTFQEKWFLAAHTKEKHSEIFSSNCNHTTLCNCETNEEEIVKKESFLCEICEKEFPKRQGNN